MDEPLDITNEPRRLGELGPRLIRGAAALGAAGFLASILIALLVPEARPRFYASYLVAFCYYLSLALGALFFVILQHLTRSGWSVVVRRLAEGIAASLPALAVLSLPVLVGMHLLYEWAHPEAVAHDALLQSKRPYLNPAFFVARVVVYFTVWVGLARFFFTRSVRQDRTGDVYLTRRMEWVSGPAMLLYAVTVTFAAFDFLMSLEPHWYSTIFGVYYFSGGVVGFFALLALAVVLVQGSGRLRSAITIEHYHDIGKLVFAFVVFWAYIAFSQYLLIWYANIPEETVWFLQRQEGSWAAMSWILLVGHFVVPFLWLVSRRPKRRKAVLALAGSWVLGVHWIDIYWLVMPSFSPGRAGLHVLDITCCLGVGGLFVASVVFALRNCSLVPEGDPRLGESLAFENV